MKKLRWILLSLAVASLIVGCASTNPAYDDAKPASATNLPYIPNTNVTTGVTVGQGVNAVTAPVNPYSGAVEIGLGLAAAIAAYIAKKKNDDAIAAADEATQHLATLNQLAASVAAQGPVVSQQVLDHAANNEALFPNVADAINKKTIV